MAFVVDQPCTLLAFLHQALPEMKKSTVKDGLKQGVVVVNGEVERRATRALVMGDTVAWRTQARTHATQAAKAAKATAALAGIEVLHVDDDLMVIHKPSGLLTVSTGTGAKEPTVLNVLGPWLRRHGRGGDRLFPCHRLDEGTSGVLLLPRRPEVQQFFFDRWVETEKTYVAVVEGVVDVDAGTIDRPLVEDPRTFSVSVGEGPQARSALTHFRVLARGSRTSLVELVIETGRKHQIRVHLQHLGHPVVGDARYGRERRAGLRLCLHARALVFPHPRGGERRRFEVAPPRLFDELVGR